MKHKGTQFIETKRLKLRRFKDGDAQQMFDNFCSDPLVTKYVNWDTHKSIDKTEEFLQMHLKKYSEDIEFYGWAIEMDKQIIGSIGAFNDDAVKSCEIGYSLGSKYWGRGIVTEALNAVLDFLFNEIGINRVTASYYERNIGSGKVMQKVNMLYEGTFREAVLLKDGTYENLVLYAILKSDYNKLKKV